MTHYITTTDKNGKARYYKVIDGKKKVISRAEYEANAEVKETAEAATEITNTAEVKAEAVESEETSADTKETATAETTAEDSGKPVEQTALETVKSIIEGTGSKHVSKIRLQVTKHCVLINYRNCMICSLVFGANHAVTALRFMGDTLETRKKASVYEYGDLNAHKEEIVRQVAFIDWWYLNPSKKSA